MIVGASFFTGLRYYGGRASRAGFGPLVGVASERLRVQPMPKLLLSFDFEDWHAPSTVGSAGTTGTSVATPSSGKRRDP